MSISSGLGASGTGASSSSGHASAMAHSTGSSGGAPARCAWSRARRGRGVPRPQSRHFAEVDVTACAQATPTSRPRLVLKRNRSMVARDADSADDCRRHALVHDKRRRTSRRERSGQEWRSPAAASTKSPSCVVSTQQSQSNCLFLTEESTVHAPRGHTCLAR